MNNEQGWTLLRVGSMLCTSSYSRLRYNIVHTRNIHTYYAYVCTVHTATLLSSSSYTSTS